jgi:hypothetical protein
MMGISSRAAIEQPANDRMDLGSDPEAEGHESYGSIESASLEWR